MPFSKKLFTVSLVISLLGPFLGARFFCSQAWASDQPDFAFQDDDWQIIQRTVREKKLNLAEKQIAQYIKTHAKNREAYLLGARIARKIHKPGSGLEILDKGLREFPGDPQITRLKAELLMERGDIVSAGGILEKLSRSSEESPSEKKKVQEDKKVLDDLAFSMPPLTTFDLNLNFLEPIPAPFQSPRTYALENNSYHLRITNTGISYAGGASIGTGVAAETPLIGNTIHFQAGANEYVGSATGQNTGLESYLYGGIDGIGPRGLQFLVDAGDVFGANQINAGFYGHVDIPAGPLRIDGQAWFQLPWSGYGEAIIQGALQSGGVVNATWSFTPDLSLSGEYEYTYDSIQGNETPFGTNHNSMVAFDWRFLKTPDLHLVAGYDTQTFTPSILNPTSLVPVLLSSDFGFLGLSSLDQIGRYVVLNGQIGGIAGTFDTPGVIEGVQSDVGASFQITPHLEFYANLSYESLAAAYIGAVTTVMMGANIWF